MHEAMIARSWPRSSSRCRGARKRHRPVKRQINRKDAPGAWYIANPQKAMVRLDTASTDVQS